MKKIFSYNGRIVILCITMAFIILSPFLISRVNVNYDLSEYLPNDSMTKEGLYILEETFGNHAVIELMIENTSLTEVYSIKQELVEIEGIKQIIWLDDRADITQPDLIDPNLLESYYINEATLLMIIFDDNSYSIQVENSIVQIRESLEEYQISIRGEALENIQARDISSKEVLALILIILPICIFILALASKSWFEPILILLVLGMAVLFNLATNAFLPHVSFITLTIVAALQLAISLDYSIFLIHRYYEYKDEGLNKLDSVIKATKKAFPVIASSALTTIFGFLALLYMRYTIGFDIGIVLSKGIFFSFMTVIFILPVLMIVFDKTLEKFKHKAFLFNLKGLRNFYIKFKYILLFVFLLVMGLSFIFQAKSEFLFSNNRFLVEDSQLAIEKENIQNQFGFSEKIVLLIKNSDPQTEVLLMKQLLEENHILDVDGIYRHIDWEVPLETVPESLTREYKQGDYSRLIIVTNIIEENDVFYDFNASLISIINEKYDDFYLIGNIPSVNEIRETILSDTIIVILFSVIAIFIVLLVTFKNLLIPFMLILVILTAIWVNMSFLAIFDTKVIYIGYIVVFALQLGATIDYAVLFTSRYLEHREKNKKNEALAYALEKATIPIMISGIILTVAGFSEFVYSDLPVVKDVGLLIGRGALISLGFVLLFLPPFLLMLDQFIIKKVNKK